MDSPAYEPDETAYKSIRDWREDERPRERLMLHGASSLSDAELLAILIGHGTRRFSALDAAKALIDRFESLNGLLSADFSALKSIKGIGDAKAVTLVAAFELSRRIQAEPFNLKKPVKTPEDAARYFIPKFRGITHELFYTLLLNSSNQVFREILVSKGSLNASVVHPREVFRTAITESAASVILMHNHPSGNTEPSGEDLKITKILKEAGEILGIKVLDHIIIAGSGFTSFVQRGLF